METITNYGILKPKKITEVTTQIGYLHVLEYVLQDNNILNIVEWYFNDELEENTNVPKIHYDSFYKEKNNALILAHYISNLLFRKDEK